ncbi:MAG: biotin/lipoyl-binding protein [Ignavibacteriaceae bacterium]|nr:biotin/lipoyl-binding protein [Ignavibacteriaceae bacterium]NUM72292.1 biotin/lipoyl-binding protein [Ignavibacteriaceae bacterium]
MKKYNFKINGNDYEVEILSLEGNIAEIEVNGTKYEIEVDKKMSKPITPKLVRTASVPSTDVHKSQTKTTSGNISKGPGSVKSPLPGTILSIAVREGDTVKSGDLLLVLEAMKMENKINSDKNGIVKSVKIRPGDTVAEGDVMIEIGD